MVFPKFELFEKVFLQVTNNYGCLVINNRIKTSDLTKKVFWFKAKKISNFTIGIPEYLEFHNKRYDKHYQDKQQLFDVINYGNKKKSNVIVKLIN